MKNDELANYVSHATKKYILEIDRLNIIIAKQIDAFNKVESIVFGNLNIPVEIRDKIQRAIYHYVTINCAKSYDEGDVPE